MGSKKDGKKKLGVKRTAISNLSGVGGGASKAHPPKPHHKPGSGNHSGGGPGVTDRLTQASATIEHTVNISVATVQLGQSSGGGQQQ